VCRELRVANAWKLEGTCGAPRGHQTPWHKAAKRCPASSDEARLQMTRYRGSNKKRTALPLRSQVSPTSTRLQELQVAQDGTGTQHFCCTWDSPVAWLITVLQNSNMRSACTCKSCTAHLLPGYLTSPTTDYDSAMLQRMAAAPKSPQRAGRQPVTRSSTTGC